MCEGYFIYLYPCLCLYFAMVEKNTPDAIGYNWKILKGVCNAGNITNNRSNHFIKQGRPISMNLIYSRIHLD